MNYSIKSLLILTLSSAILTAPFFAKAQEVREITFPVAGDSFTMNDNFGAPRSGGRTHEGIDIMADKMTPLLSAVNGRVTMITETEESWGYAIYIEDSEGYSYRYLHLNNDTPGTDDGQGGAINAFAPGITRGALVTAGQHVAFLGDSGNAEETGAHLHFEILTPGRTVINPFPSLVNTLAGSIPSASYIFTRDLELGDEGNDVKELQKYLNSIGFVISVTGAGSPGNETTYFGPATQKAVIEFQKKHYISPAEGYVGPLTRAVINRISPVVQNPTPVANPLGVQPGDLVKNLKYIEVFHVDQNLKLQWVVNEAAAIKHFGPTWNQNIKEFADLNQFGLSFGQNLQ